MIPMRVAQSNEYHGPRSTEQTMFIRCAVGHIPSILRMGEMTTPMATIMASMTILSVFDLSVFIIMNLLGLPKQTLSVVQEADKILQKNLPE